MTSFDRYKIEIHFVSNATDISSVLKTDDQDHTCAIDEYQEFLINIFAVLDEHEFNVLDEETGYQSEHSYCIVARNNSGSIVKNL